MNRRRKLLVVLGIGTLGAPLCSFAQQSERSIAVGVLRNGDRLSSQRRIAALKQGLQEFGYIEGKNLTLQLRFADGNAARLGPLAEELVQLQVDVIITGDTPSTLAVQRATKVIPIIIGSATDPVGTVLVASLAHPGGNTTGVSNFSSDTSPKRLEMLIALVPKLSRVAVLLDSSNPATRIELKSLEEANKGIRLKLLAEEAATPEQIDSAFFAMAAQHAEGVVITNNSFFTHQMNQIAGLVSPKNIGAVTSYLRGPAAMQALLFA